MVSRRGENKSETVMKTRREFFKIVGGLSGLFFVGCHQKEYDLPHNKPPVPGSENWYIGEERFIKSACGQCFVNCGIVVRVVEGRAVKIEGNPISTPNGGRLGPKGNTGVFVLYDPDRIRSPLIRDGRKGEGKWKEVSWDEAISFVVEKLNDLRKQGKANKVAVLCGKPKGFIRDLFELFAYGYGTPNFYDYYSKSYSATPIVMAMMEAVGVFDLPGYDFQSSQYILSLGAGLFGATCHGIHFLRGMYQIKYGRPVSRGKLVQVEPFPSETAKEADEWISIKPGKYDVLALGIANILISENMYDRKFIEEKTEGFDSFKELVKNFPPSRVEKETSVPASDIVRLARELWNSRPSVVVVDERSVSTTNNLSIACTALSLNALLGNINSPGGLIIRKELMFSPWKVKYSKPGESIRFAELPDSDVSALLIYYMNPAYSEPDNSRWVKLLERTFVVSFSPFMDETSAYADVILPDHTYLERFEDAQTFSSVPYPAFGIRQPVVEHLYNTKNTGDVVIEIGKKLGLDFYFEDFKSAVEERLSGVVDIEKLLEEGWWEDKSGEFGEFKTPSRKFVFCTKHISEPKWVGDGDVYLLPYKSITYAEGSGANIPYLQELSARLKKVPGHKSYETFLEISSKLAEKLGVKNGDYVFVTTYRGKFKLPVLVVDGMPEDIALIEMGKGHRNFGRFAKGRGFNPRDVLPAVESQAGNLSHWVMKVKIEKS